MTAPEPTPAPAPASAPFPPLTPVVGFDLDMTLVDSRPGIRACYQALAERTGVYIDADLVVSRLGPPVEDEMAHWFPADKVVEMAALYRRLYPEYAVTGTLALPGAPEAIEAVHAAGGRAIVVTAKHEPNAKLHMEYLRLTPDVVVGDLWAEQKAEALKEYGAHVYVGDHVGDVRGARTAGALSVGVTTGPCGAEELRTAGADVVLDDLLAFPGWLSAYLADAPEAADPSLA
ncbi:haloacid dehalogenase-like hydrolase [Streptomyces niveiscabiei]|uniref:HAD family hydrolase n=1 Tax=Streptomyces niveiscabiei TaxID=164115 RepID=UPI0029B7855B|nr:haloacid dehalogenase-like hydrolase [Streptomyces niveiscabiei]MDX3385122.1 haloacid dehalogenase-like hydrolase [Streptomyces niveiscabiei]